MGTTRPLTASIRVGELLQKCDLGLIERGGGKLPPNDASQALMPGALFVSKLMGGHTHAKPTKIVNYVNLAMP